MEKVYKLQGTNVHFVVSRDGKNMRVSELMFDDDVIYFIPVITIKTEEEFLDKHRELQSAISDYAYADQQAA